MPKARRSLLKDGEDSVFCCPRERSRTARDPRPLDDASYDFCAEPAPQSGHRLAEPAPGMEVNLRENCRPSNGKRSACFNEREPFFLGQNLATSRTPPAMTTATAARRRQPLPTTGERSELFTECSASKILLHKLTQYPNLLLIRVDMTARTLSVHVEAARRLPSVLRRRLLLPSARLYV